MRRTFLAAWLLCPVVLVAWHFGPGTRHLARDRAGDRWQAARAAESAERWEQAAALYQSARDALPTDDPDRDRLELAEARSRINAGQMIEGQEQLQKLLDKLEVDPQANPALVSQAAGELAESSYYAAWIMRLEGATAEEWKPEAERARQQFRLLAEQAESARDPQAGSLKGNLEAAVRLEQMDLSTLLAKPLPKKCGNCKNLSQRKRKQCQSQCRSAGKKEAKKDARQLIHNDAGLNQREGKGS
jgi:hypothetical protein